jgi:hypothetical protein
MIDSMFLGIFAGMFSCFVALLLNYALVHDEDQVDLDRSLSVAKTSLYLLTTMLICIGAAVDYSVGSLGISVYTMFGMFAFVIADELVNSSIFAGLAGETE